MKLDKEREFNSIVSLYDSVLVDYIDLENSLDIYEPESIFSFYCFMYKNGFLSNGHHFYPRSEVIESDVCESINVICGSGHSRGITSLLNDIYIKDGIQSYRLNVHNSKGQYSFDDKRQMLRFFRFCTNHVVNSVIYNGKVYYFDPTYFRMYDKFGNSLSDGEVKLIVKKYYRQYLNGLSMKDVSDIMSLKSAFYLGKAEFNKIQNRCLDNLDMLEHFYNDNEDKYSEIYDKNLSLFMRR